MSTEAPELFQLDALRPPTFEQLIRILRAANSAGQPYHVIHFDGHGVYAAAMCRTAPSRRTASPTRPRLRPGRAAQLCDLRGATTEIQQAQWLIEQIERRVRGLVPLRR